MMITQRERTEKKLYIFLVFFGKILKKTDGTMLTIYQRGLIWMVTLFTIFPLTTMYLVYPHLPNFGYAYISFWLGGGEQGAL